MRVRSLMLVVGGLVAAGSLGACFNDKATGPDDGKGDYTPPPYTVPTDGPAVKALHHSSAIVMHRR